jgi:hypothetical protein
MKRDHVSLPAEVFRSFPIFFWVQCACCKKDFRREKGWRWLSGPYVNGAGRWKYICSECAPTREVAAFRAKSMQGPPLARPAPPPNPPILGLQVSGYSTTPFVRPFPDVGDGPR